MTAELLEQPHLSIIGRNGEGELQRIEQTIARPLVVGGRAELETALCDLLGHGRAGVPKTLDLIGHSTAHTSLLLLGDWVIDATSSVVSAFFRELAEQNVLARLGINAVRLLGCTTAETTHGKWTVGALAEILNVDVYGTTGLLLASHYDAHGFSDERRYLLVSASELRARGAVAMPIDNGKPTGYVLDIDALPPLPLGDPRTCPVHVVTMEQARELLSLVRRREGAVIPSLAPVPWCEIALPSSTPGLYHRIEVLYQGALVRATPRGSNQGIVYPISNPEVFRQLLTYSTPR